MAKKVRIPHDRNEFLYLECQKQIVQLSKKDRQEKRQIEMTRRHIREKNVL